MKSKTFIITILSFLLVGMTLISCLQIAIDPLFQYHTPWFGMKPVIMDERYQYAGIAKNFEYDNVILGNSFCENYKASDFDKAFGGKTVKLAISGSITKDWCLLLDIIKQRKDPPKRIFLNIDPYSILSTPPETPSSLPSYLYDNNLLNDVNYFYNFGTVSFTIDMFKQNMENSVPDIDTAFLRNARGKETILNDYLQSDFSDEALILNDAINRANQNLSFLLPYIEDMQDTEFYFFITPVSILYWDKVHRERNEKNWYSVFHLISENLLANDNVKLFLWTDNEMLDIIRNLDNYVDEAHYSPEVCEMLVKRMSKKEGLLSVNIYNEQINKLFDYVNHFDYESLF